MKMQLCRRQRPVRCDLAPLLLAKFDYNQTSPEMMVPDHGDLCVASSTRKNVQCMLDIALSFCLILHCR